MDFPPLRCRYKAQICRGKKKSDNTLIPLNEKFRMFPWRRG